MKRVLKTAVQVFNILLLAVLAVVMFLTTIGRPLANIVYVLAVVLFFAVKGAFSSWLFYLILLAGGLAVLNLVGMAFGGVITSLWNSQLARTFGHPADENEGGAVPVSCAKPFDPTEKALNQLELEFERNAVTEEEYLKRKDEILNNKGEN
ncbi:MAG: hypothetical protein IJZ72_01625 [Oscillospiraceae bacterium]|nr:hypothetical protein [Oscillospiraceae bacterium]